MTYNKEKVFDDLKRIYGTDLFCSWDSGVLHVYHSGGLVASLGDIVKIDFANVTLGGMPIALNIKDYCLQHTIQLSEANVENALKRVEGLRAKLLQA